MMPPGFRRAALRKKILKSYGNLKSHRPFGRTTEGTRPSDYLPSRLFCCQPKAEYSNHCRISTGHDHFFMYFCTTACEPKADVLDPDLPAGCTAAAQVFQVKVIEGLVSTSVYVVHSNSILGEGDEVVCNVVSTGLMICIRHGSYHKICLVLVQDIRRVLVCSIN
jgi:hypothetical protein